MDSQIPKYRAGPIVPRHQLRWRHDEHTTNFHDVFVIWLVNFNAEIPSPFYKAGELRIAKWGSVGEVDDLRV
jgi:hypothetical protein